MNNYILSLIVISIISGIVNMLTSHFGATKKYISYFVSLIMVICLLSPILKALEYKDSIKNKIEDFYKSFDVEGIVNNSNNIIISSSAEAISKGVKSEIVNKFGLDENEVIVNVKFDKTNIEAVEITEINVILTGKASWSDVDSVKEYLQKIIGGSVFVTRK